LYGPAKDDQKEKFLAEMVNMCSHENLPIKEDVIYNLESIGINPGNGESEVCKEVDRIKSRENDRCVEQFTKDEVSRIFDQEEKELAEEEEVDKLILNSLCSEIMDQGVPLTL
jgi:isopropylmalate/homocitrate/citramalate synthase